MNGPHAWLCSWRQRRELKRIRAIIAALPPGPTSAEALIEHEAPFARYYSERWVMWAEALRPAAELAAQMEPLHAHELTADDAALLRMMRGAKFGPNAKLTLPSGRTISGAEAQRWTEDCE